MMSPGMGAPTPAKPSHDPYGKQSHEVQAKSSHDPYGKQSHEVQAKSSHDPYGKQAHEVQAKSSHDPYGKQAHEVQAKSSHDPYGKQAHAAPAIGAPVHAQWQDGQWHPARVVAHQNGMVGVDWDNPALGQSSWVQPHQVRAV